MIQITINLRAVLIGFVLLLVAAGIATPFAISLADDGPSGDRVSEQRAVLGTAFTYRGQLDSGSGPANGTYAFEFRLFDSLTGGAQVGLPFSTTRVVTNGFFAIELDFGGGPTIFDGTARWLEVKVKLITDATYVALAPRQQLTPVPYALHVPWSGITGLPSTFADGVDDNTTYSAQTPLALNGTSFTFDTTGCQANDVWKYTGAAWSCDADAGGAAGAHDHFGQAWTGGTVGSGLQVANSQGVGLEGLSSTSYGVNGTTVSGFAGVGGFGGTAANGVYGETRAFTKSAVYGRNFGNGAGLTGLSDDDVAGNDSGVGVYGSSGGLDAFPPLNTGVFGTGYGQNAVGVVGKAVGPASVGVEGFSSASVGVQGWSTTGTGIRGSSGTGGGVFGQSQSGNGVYGDTSGGGSSGVYGRNFANGNGVTGISDGPGVVGASGGYETPPAVGQLGVFGVAYGSNAVGIRGKAVGPDSFAGYFDGRVFASLGYSSPPSDLRLKTNVGSMASGLGAVEQLRPVTFNWKDGRDVLSHDGLIAQEVQAILPDLVVMGPDGYYGLDYNGLTAVLVKAIQEQQAQIDALKGGTTGSASPSTDDTRGLAGPSPTEPQVTVIREASASPLNGWALPGAIVFFGLGLFAVAIRRKV